MTERERRLQAEADKRWRTKQATLREWVNATALAAGVHPLRLAAIDPEEAGDLLRPLARAVARG